MIGPTGAGKTTLGLQFVAEGLRQGDRCLFVNFDENPAQLRRQLNYLGVDPSGAGGENLSLLYVSPVELQIDSIVNAIIEHIREGGVRRIVIDSLSNLHAATTDANRPQSYLYALSQHFAVVGVASFLTLETLGAGAGETHFSARSDNIFVLGIQLGQTPRRTVRVAKARVAGLKAPGPGSAGCRPGAALGTLPT